MVDTPSWKKTLIHITIRTARIGAAVRPPPVGFLTVGSKCPQSEEARERSKYARSERESRVNKVHKRRFPLLRVGRDRSEEVSRASCKGGFRSLGDRKQRPIV